MQNFLVLSYKIMDGTISRHDSNVKKDIIKLVEKELKLLVTVRWHDLTSSMKVYYTCDDTLIIPSEDKKPKKGLFSISEFSIGEPLCIIETNAKKIEYLLKGYFDGMNYVGLQCCGCYRGKMEIV